MIKDNNYYEHLGKAVAWYYDTMGYIDISGNCGTSGLDEIIEWYEEYLLEEIELIKQATSIPSAESIQ